MEEAQEQLETLLGKAQSSKLDLSKLSSIRKRKKLFRVNWKLWFLLSSIIVTCVAFDKFSYLLNSETCAVLMPVSIEKIFRKPEDCSICRGIDSEVRLSNIQPREFEEKYAYSGHVVVVTDAMQNWSATEIFDFRYFKKLYETHDPKKKTLDCQFFRYKTGFKNLFDAFKMDSERADYKLDTDPWYIGWESCNEHIATMLREHYDRPYFLPATAELATIDWIFMGGRGLGAQMHLDEIKLPSWQAQLKGIKEWQLAPPPECLYVCKYFSVIVRPGDIIVLKTDKWFHKTNVISDEISITIGTEYD